MKHKTEFQKRVYKIVKQIPRGSIVTYAAVARAIGHPKAYRAVGNALNKNTNPKIPCHRVIRSDGKAGGFRWGTKKKIELLKEEGLKIVKLKIQ